VRSGELNEARDFPAPEGGRAARFGKSVTFHFTVTTDGRARDCSVASSQVDAATTARVCPLVMERIRFNPATTREGTPVEARCGYRVDFRARE
jgi:protein TonB